jgi:hypothetical protein
MSIHQAARARKAITSPFWLYKLSGFFAITAGILLLVGLIKHLSVVFFAGDAAWQRLFPDNWLIVIFQLLVGFAGVSANRLQGLFYPDMIILALVGAMDLGLYMALKRTNRIWALVAAVQPFLGIALMLATQTAGRSALMTSGLVISLVMLKSTIFKETTAVLGILASALLLVGDLTVGVFPRNALGAALFAIGYVLMIIWLFLVGRRLFLLE